MILIPSIISINFRESKTTTLLFEEKYSKKIEQKKKKRGKEKLKKKKGNIEKQKGNIKKRTTKISDLKSPTETESNHKGSFFTRNQINKCNQIPGFPKFERASVIN